MRRPGPWLLLGALLVGPAWATLRLSSRVDPWLFGGIAVGLSLGAFLLCRADKRRAEVGSRRIPESTLHASELLGGWPGAFVAQRVFRHKTAKTSYQVAFWLIVLVHQILAWELATGGWLFRRIAGAR